MVYSNLRHLKLLKYRLKLNQANKTLVEESPNLRRELFTYETVVRDSIFWLHRKEFFSIIELFISNNSNFEKFELDFSKLYIETETKFRNFVNDIKQIEKFQPNLQSEQFSSFVTAIFRETELVEDEYCSEEEVKEYVKDLYLKTFKI